MSCLHRELAVCKLSSNPVTCTVSIASKKLHKTVAYLDNVVQNLVIVNMWCTCDSCSTQLDSTQLSEQLNASICARHKFLYYYHDHTTTVLWPFYRDHPGEPVPEENFWTLWCKGRLTEADTLTIRLGGTPSGLTSANLHHPRYFLQACCPSCHPTNSVKALKAKFFVLLLLLYIVYSKLDACMYDM